eukprot:scpid111070/ scgid17930/ 
MYMYMYSSCPYMYTCTTQSITCLGSSYSLDTGALGLHSRSLGRDTGINCWRLDMPPTIPSNSTGCPPAMDWLSGGNAPGALTEQEKRKEERVLSLNEESPLTIISADSMLTLLHHLLQNTCTLLPDDCENMKLVVAANK